MAAVAGGLSFLKTQSDCVARQCQIEPFGAVVLRQSLLPAASGGNSISKGGLHCPNVGKSYNVVEAQSGLVCFGTQPYPRFSSTSLGPGALDLLGLRDIALPTEYRSSIEVR
jgi:hypothetical protein